MPRLLPVLLSLAFLTVAAPASAQMAWAPCEPAGYECGALEVPLDRSGASPGTVVLQATRSLAPQNPGKVAVLGLAGGPGEAAKENAAAIATVVAPALATRDFLTFDQRGTGESGRLRCQALGRRGKIREVAASCAKEIGARRAFYTTPDSVEDIEALRAAAGYEKLAIVAASYGTKVAMQYAARYPDRVESLLLGSPRLPDGPDVFQSATLQATNRVLGELCASNACRGITPNAAADLRRLANRLARRGPSKPLTGRIVDRFGKRIKLGLVETDLFRLVLGGDLNPTVRAELPAALRNALHGDRTPLLRLIYRGAGITGGPPRPSLGADALFATTSCEEQRFPWTRTAKIGQKEQEGLLALRRLPASAFGPWSRGVALNGGLIPLCIAWPVLSGPPPVTPPLPAVPTLVFSGRADVRTPYEDALRAAALVPGGQVVDLPHMGHAVFAPDRTGCRQPAVEAFYAGNPAPPCTNRRNPYPPSERPPVSLNRVKPVGGLEGKRGRTLAAVRGTILDALRQVVGEAFALGRTPPSVGGLRSGRATVSGDLVTLRAYEYVPGVVLEGVITTNGAGQVTVRGRHASSGNLNIASNGAVDGRLGGKSLATSLASMRVPR